MKLIIDIPDHTYEEYMTMKKNNIQPYFPEGERIVSGVPIPDNISNGELFDILFDVNIEHNYMQSVGVRLNDSNYVEFNASWWDAKYEGSERLCQKFQTE